MLVTAAACSGDGPAVVGAGEVTSTGAPTTAPTGAPADGTTGAVQTSFASESHGGATYAPRFDVHYMPDLPPGGHPPMPLPSCEQLAKLGPTSLGCEFWAIDLDSAGNSIADPGLGVGLGNPSGISAHVAIEDMRGPGDSLREVGAFDISPQQSITVAINGVGGLLPGEDDPPWAGVDKRTAFRITSDSPISAFQINPLGGASGVVPEASLLLPTTALVGPHYALGYESEGGIDFVIVVATADDTLVSTSEGDEMLDAFDTLRYPTGSSPGWSATGFFVAADKPVAVFSGDECTYVGGVAWCDHLEEQAIPLASWGTHYVGAAHPKRAAEAAEHELVVWRVVAGVDDTDVVITPAITDSPIHIADAGDYVQFSTSEHFVAQSDDDHPFMLVQYMTGGAGVEECLPGIPAGDPWMIQMVPTAQWLQSLAFSTDSSHVRDFVFVARAVGTLVSIACYGVIPDERFEPIAGTDFEVGWIDLDNVDGGDGDCVDGQQFLTADAPVAAYVGGVDCAASYGFPGGMNLAELWVPPATPPG